LLPHAVQMRAGRCPYAVHVRAGRCPHAVHVRAGCCHCAVHVRVGRGHIIWAIVNFCTQAIVTTHTGDLMTILPVNLK